MVRILYVEDNPDDFELTRMQILRGEKKFLFERAESAEEALSILQEKEFDCVLSDFQMPGMNGLELLKALRQSNNLIPFVFLTGQGSEEIAASALRSGADAYYTKEVGFAHYSRLINTIRRVVDALITSVVKRDASGKIVSYQGIIRDVTEQRRAEEELRYQEEKYRTLFHHSNDMIFLHDLEGRIIDVNREVLSKFGFSGEEMLQKNIAELHPPEAMEQSLWAFQTITKVNNVSFAIDFVKKDGSVFKAEVSSSVFEIGGRKLIQGIVRDVTERKLAEDFLRRERDFTQSIMETSPVGIVVVSNEGVIQYANPRAEKVLGLKKSEMTQRNYDDSKWRITDLEGGPFPAESLPFNVVAGTLQPVYGVEHAILLPDGRRVLLSVNAAPVLDAAGELDCVVAMVNDITESRRIEQALRESEERFRVAFHTSPDAVNINRLEDGLYIDVN